MTDKIRAGVIGCGILGTRHSAELHQDERTELVAVADVKEEKAREIATKEQCRAYTDYEQMLAKEELELVVVATPDPYHRAPVVACAQAGVKYLLLQKPMATMVEDAEAMMAAAERVGMQIYMIFATRWLPANMATQYAIRSGLIGEPVYGEAFTDDSITVPLEMWGGQGQTWANASSTAHFLHSHLVDRLRWYLAPAEVESVFAITQKRVLGFAPDLYDAFLIFNNGFKARLKTGWISYIEGGVENKDTYNGVRGQIFNNISSAFGVSVGWRVNVAQDVPLEELVACQQALLKRGLASRVISREQRITGWMRGVRRGLELEMDGCLRPNPTKQIIDGIVEKTLTPKSWQEWQGDGPLPTGKDGLAQTKVVCAIVESARLNRTVRVQ